MAAFNTKISGFIDVLAEYRGPESKGAHAPIKETHLGNTRAWDWLDFVDHCLRGPERDSDGAWHSLGEAPDVILPLLMNAYAKDAEQRAFLVNVIWEHRSRHTVPFLAMAAADGSTPVWKAALDGLVAMKAVEALHGVGAQAVESRLEEKIGWLDEAIEQAEEAGAPLP